MGRLFILYYVEIPDRDCVHCRLCGTRIAFIRYHFADISNHTWIFEEVFNVEVPEDERYHGVLSGNTLAETYCIKCRNLLGWKLVAVPQPRRTVREGIFYIMLSSLGPIEQGRNNQDGGANVQNADQDGDANEQNADQDEGANEHTNDQDGGANEQNADQDEGANEQTAEQDEGANEQTGEQGVQMNI